MLYKNDIFLLSNRRHRLLHAEPSQNKAWAINLDDDKQWPLALEWGFVFNLEPYVEMESLSIPLSGESGGSTPQNIARHLQLTTLNATPAMLRVRDTALAHLGKLTSQFPAIFDKRERSRLILERAKEAGCSVPTLYKHVRQYWVGGQTSTALLGNFHRCGRVEVGVTSGRGATPQAGHVSFQLTPRDCDFFEKIIKQYYLKDVRLKMTHVYQRLLEAYYVVEDGNGKPWIQPVGERPSFKQFEYYLRKHFPLQVRLRSREGDKDFERDHRPVLSTVLADCQGVGHYYEADATVADVYLVATDDIRRIVGKPTIYLIIDRKSRLIVGWYVGLENPSWICAMQAMLSISQDKQNLCARLDVEYDPGDWPAHQVFPKEFLADRGELLTKVSNQISDELAVTVTNVPAKRGDWKPVVECGFKQTRMILQDGTPGFDPPENAKKRQGKHYEKDACLTLRQFEAVVLHAIIAHNHSPLREYRLSLKEIANNIEPLPLALWKNDIIERAGVLPRFQEDHVRMALLPRDDASVSEEGILFRGCHYTCQEALTAGWFVTGRKRRFKVSVSFDGRLVDTIFVRDPNRQGYVYKCNLTPRSDRYVGLSFAEVAALEKFQKMLRPAIEQTRIQALANFHSSTEPIIQAAKKELRSAGIKTSRTARRADTKDARFEELRTERQELASPPNMKLAKTSAEVVSLPLNRNEKSSFFTESRAQSLAVVTPVSAQDKLTQMKNRMFRG